MSIRVETEQTYGIKDRKIAGIIAFSAFVLLSVLLGFIGYYISNPSLPKLVSSEEMTLVPLNPQILEQARKGGQSGTPAKAEKSRTTPQQTEQILTQQNSNLHIQSGNSHITNAQASDNHPSSAKHVSENPFGTGGINGGNSFGNNPHIGDDQVKDQSDFKSGENNKRFLVKKPNTTTIQSDENCKIVLSVLVDQNGNIIGNPTFTKNGSTTNDMVLINQVIKTVKNQAQFNTVNTTKNTKEAIVIRITAN